MQLLQQLMALIQQLLGGQAGGGAGNPINNPAPTTAPVNAVPTVGGGANPTTPPCPTTPTTAPAAQPSTTQAPAAQATVTQPATTTQPAATGAQATTTPATIATTAPVAGGASQIIGQAFCGASPCWSAGDEWEDNIGGPGPQDIDVMFQSQVTGTSNAIKLYMSQDSHALLNKCNTSGDDNPCILACAQNTSCWQPYAAACAANDSGCYAAGNGGVIVIELQSDNGNHQPSGTVLATATITHPADIFSFTTFYPVIKMTANLTAGQYYHIVMRNTDPDPAHNWTSFDSFTPLNGISNSAAQQSGVTNACILNRPVGGSWSGCDSRFYPAFQVALGTASVGNTVCFNGISCPNF